MENKGEFEYTTAVAELRDKSELQDRDDLTPVRVIPISVIVDEWESYMIKEFGNIRGPWIYLKLIELRKKNNWLRLISLFWSKLIMVKIARIKVREFKNKQTDALVTQIIIRGKVVSTKHWSKEKFNFN